jgi:regulator of cell morphogenesis and NO signaling
MTLTAEKTVRELAVENPAATRVFERLHIDYCCGGNRTLADACRAAGAPLDRVLTALDEAAAAPEPAVNRDWQTEPLADLVAHIRDTHHVYTREAFARIPLLLDKVCSVHGGNHPELHGIRTTFAALVQELTTHMMKEEMVLFPYIVRMEEAVLADEPVLPPPFGTVRNPVAMMMREHDAAGDELREIREASNGYTAPPDGCITYQTVYRAMAEFEADLHQHIHLENNILFPRALNMER